VETRFFTRQGDLATLSLLHRRRLYWLKAKYVRRSIASPEHAPIISSLPFDTESTLRRFGFILELAKVMPASRAASREPGPGQKERG
jgi:hypothetical protein